MGMHQPVVLEVLMFTFILADDAKRLTNPSLQTGTKTLGFGPTRGKESTYRASSANPSLSKSRKPTAPVAVALLAPVLVRVRVRVQGLRLHHSMLGGFVCTSLRYVPCRCAVKRVR